jgi:hypothetical protein
LAIEQKAKTLYIFQRDINFMIQKAINFSIIGNNKQQNELKNIIITPHSYPINKEIINLEKFIAEGYNSYQEKSKKNQTIEDEVKGSLINNSSSKNNLNIKFKCICSKKNIIEKDIFALQTNNEIKVLKNNKIVYVNKDLLNSYSTSRTIKKLKKVNFVIRKKRSSKYRGVSKNGSNWQVLIMINKKKYFLGNYPSEDLAARIYDIKAIKSWGVKARTNFAYDKSQIQKIYNKKINIKCDNISDILAQINN